MTLKKITNLIITLLLFVGVWGAGGLVIDEIQTGNGCPKIWIIPACLIILICFLIPLIVHLLKRYTPLYFIFTGLAASIAIIASIMQYTGNGSCPKLDGGTPMCYLSFILFTTLIILKITNHKPKTQK
ncbi:hypothetical protein [Dokdonia sp.]|uniref:hypothetical protein n=1 Tax=Dokdonia sp. TaxID=2024995 RepID=UPI0032642C90